MNRRCERGEQTSAATVSGLIDPETAAHAQQCRECSDTLLVGEFLRDRNALTDQEQAALPDSGLIWQKAQHRETQRAVRLALRPIRLMSILACVIFSCSPWVGLLLPRIQGFGSSWARTLDSALVLLPRTWPATPNQPMLLLGLSGTVILLALGSWLMLRED